MSLFYPSISVFIVMKVKKKLAVSKPARPEYRPDRFLGRAGDSFIHVCELIWMLFIFIFFVGITVYCVGDTAVLRAARRGRHGDRSGGEPGVVPTSKHHGQVHEAVPGDVARPHSGRAGREH